MHDLELENSQTVLILVLRRNDILNISDMLNIILRGTGLRILINLLLGNNFLHINWWQNNLVVFMPQIPIRDREFNLSIKEN